ncbi:MAG TPA: hypothetical protein DIT25_01170 [Candidatus Moranbacteria bacterium]|nr:hypothetical protein [Candidatus Moranbacteria bacterium]
MSKISILTEEGELIQNIRIMLSSLGNPNYLYDAFGIEEKDLSKLNFSELTKIEEHISPFAFL